jgi:hypothetical protein
MNRTDARARIVGRHEVRCPLCRGKFDLFSAPWCACEANDSPAGLRTRICAVCEACLCNRPEAGDPLCWIEPPSRFRREGFHRLLVFYL